MSQNKKFEGMVMPVFKPIASSYGKLSGMENGRKRLVFYATDYCYEFGTKMRRIYQRVGTFEFYIIDQGCRCWFNKESNIIISRLINTPRKDVRNSKARAEQVLIKPPEKKCKVLIIEGGGAFGIIPAYFLSGMDSMRGIDCISGCSIGGILALCYAAGRASKRIFNTFKERMEECFDKRFMARVNPLANPTYDNGNLLKLLDSMLEENRVMDIRKIYPELDVFVPALNLTQNKYKVFDNITGGDDMVLLRDIAAFTSAAPSYFKGLQWGENCMIDGGMIEVAPLITTVTGLFGKRGIRFDQMDVLMIGCGYRLDSKKMTTEEYNDLSLLGVATDLLAPYVTMSNALSTLYWGQNLGLGSFTYFNPVPVSGGMDDVSAMEKALKECAKHKAVFDACWDKWMGSPK